MMTMIANVALSKRTDGPPLEFIAVWMALGLISFLFFHFNRNAALKRAVFPIFIVVVGVVFVGLAYFVEGQRHPQILYIVVPAILLSSFLNIRTTRFCDSCGRTLYRQPVFSRTQFCPHCGAKLNA